MIVARGYPVVVQVGGLSIVNAPVDNLTCLEWTKGLEDGTVRLLTEEESEEFPALDPHQEYLLSNGTVFLVYVMEGHIGWVECAWPPEAMWLYNAYAAMRRLTERCALLETALDLKNRVVLPLKEEAANGSPDREAEAAAGTNREAPEAQAGPQGAVCGSHSGREGGKAVNYIQDWLAVEWAKRRKEALK